MHNREKENIKVYALGGLGELGKNMYVVEVGADIFILDSGFMLPENEMLGVDVVIPDIQHLRKYKEHIRGIFITQGNDEHFGGLPYILSQLPVPVFGNKLTISILRKQLRTLNIGFKIKLHEVDKHTILSFDNAKVSFFNMTGTMPGSLGIYIDTKQGGVVYTGQFKIDQTPVDALPIEFDKLAEINRKGVLCLLSNSSHATIPGFSKSESSVFDDVLDVFNQKDERIIVATTSSNLHQIQQIFNAASLNNRKVMIVGKSDPIIDMALKTNVLKTPKGLLIAPHKVEEWSNNRLVVLVTGNLGRTLKEMTKIATNNHRLVHLKQSDTVFMGIESTPIHEKLMGKTVDLLFRAKVDVIFNPQKYHVSSAACQEELKLLLTMLEPEYLVPVNGEYRMQKAHEKLALELGMNRENIFLLDNGEVIEFKNWNAQVTGKVTTGNTLIDGLGIGDIGNIVLRDRKLLSQDGILIVVVTLNKKRNEIAVGPEILSRGFVYVRESESLLIQSTEIVNEVIQTCIAENMTDWSTLKTKIRESLSHFLYDKTKRRPIVLPIIMEV